jgi:hypothetical protein
VGAIDLSRLGCDDFETFARLVAGLEGSPVEYREFMQGIVQAYKKSHPQADGSDFARDFNRALSLTPDAQCVALRSAGPVNVLTHPSAIRRGNKSGIIAVCLVPGNKLSWEEGKIAFTIATHVESAAGGIARNLSEHKQLALAQTVVALVEQQQQAGLHMRTVFRTARAASFDALSRSKQEGAIASRFFLSTLQGCQNPCRLIRDVLDRSQSIAFADPSLMSPLCTDAFDSLSECYPDLPRQQLPALLTDGLNEMTNSAAFSCVVTDSPNIVVLRDARLGWRLNPYGNFSVQLRYSSGDEFVDFVASKVASMIEILLRNSAAWLGKPQHTRHLTTAVLRSITFLSPGLTDCD